MEAADSSAEYGFKLSACHPEMFTDTWKQDCISVKHNLLLLCCYIYLGYVSTYF